MYVMLIQIWELAKQSTRGSVCAHQSYLRAFSIHCCWGLSLLCLKWMLRLGASGWTSSFQIQVLPTMQSGTSADVSGKLPECRGKATHCYRLEGLFLCTLLVSTALPLNMGSRKWHVHAYLTNQRQGWTVAFLTPGALRNWGESC